VKELIRGEAPQGPGGAPTQGGDQG
jgi:hypothetical protein